MPPKKIPLAKITILVKRKNGISFEDFDKHWSQSHGPLFASLPIVKEKIIKYTQIHLNKPKMEELTANKGLSLYYDFDGLMHAYAETVDDLLAVLESDDYNNIVVPDELKFLQREECKMLFGYDEVHWDRDDPSFSSSS